MMKQLKHAYLVYSLCTLLACAIIAGIVIIAGPFTNYHGVIDMNRFGEGLFEAIGVLLALPGWGYLGRQAMDERRAAT